MSQKMIQPNPDEPCQWCGATEHKEPTRCFEGKECSHCGGIHYGSFNCPYSVTQVSAAAAQPDNPAAGGER